MKKTILEIVKNKRFIVAAALTAVSVAVIVVQKRAEPVLEIDTNTVKM